MARRCCGVLLFTQVETLESWGRRTVRRPRIWRYRLCCHETEPGLVVIRITRMETSAGGAIAARHTVTMTYGNHALDCPTTRAPFTFADQLATGPSRSRESLPRLCRTIRR